MVGTLGLPIETTVVFVCVVIVSLTIDLYAHKSDQRPTLKSAVLWSIFWVAVSLAYGGFLYYHHGSEVSSLFFTGYVLEKVLSVDNLFVMMAIFSWFAIPDRLRHRVLYWGVMGAIVFRAIFVAIGTGLLAFGPWVEVIFALIVAYTAVMMLKSGGDDDEIDDYSGHIAYRLVKRLFPVWPRLTGSHFFVKNTFVAQEMEKPENQHLHVVANSKAVWFATPLLLCLAVIELSDVMFAFDSVPAVIAVSREPLIIYSAMIFAILGLRSLYFVLEALKQYMSHLEKAVIVLLFFISVKLALNATDHLFGHGLVISANLSLVIVLSILAVGIVASVLFPEKADDSEVNS